MRAILPARRRVLQPLLQDLESRTLLSYDISGVQPAALDQPRVNVVIRLTPTGSPLTTTDSTLGTNSTTYNVPVYYDTGASGALLSVSTADALGISRASSNGQPIVYSDVGVGGSDNFYVSDPIYASLGVNGGMLDGITIDPNDPTNITYTDPPLTSYTQSFGPIRVEIGAIPADAPPDVSDVYDVSQLLADLDPLDVFGMPTIAGKVMVMDPKPTNAMIDGFESTTADPTSVLGGSMRTYIYNPGTAFDAANADTDPGIPATNRHIRLSLASFDRFTTVTPTGAPGPTLAANPFIGPNPVLGMSAGAATDSTPPVSLKFGDSPAVTGSFLLDTGAAASMISQATAGKLGVRYRAGTFNTDAPILEDTNGNTIPDQFTLDIGGVGGIIKVAGFFLDEMSLPTVENDPIRYLGAPVLVSDVTVADATTGQTLTLDGVFGMNNLVASAMISMSADSLMPDIGALNKTPFDWVVFDPQSKLLSVEIPGLPTPPSASLAAVPAITTGGTTAVRLTVTYSGVNPITAASIDNSDLVVTGPGGIAVAAVAAKSALVDAKTLAVTYTLVPPGGSWANALAGTYTVAMRAGQVSDSVALSVPAGQLRTFVITDTTPPTAAVSALAAAVTGKADYSFKVVYSDNTAINLTTLNTGDILVTGPQSFKATATYVSRVVTSPGRVTVTYKIAAPKKKWSSVSAGTYTITLQAKQVADTAGKYALTKKLGAFRYAVKSAAKLISPLFASAPIVPATAHKDDLADLLN